MANRFQVLDDDHNEMRPRFSRRFAVLDTKQLGWDGLPVALLETNSEASAHAFADLRNLEG